MKAVVFDGALGLRDVPRPARGKGDVLIRVAKAGICNTDHEIVRGYMPGFTGILGHEFVGVVTEAADASLVGARVTAEINCACGTCAYCRRGLGRHCPHRTVLGIVNRDGAFAEYVSVPAPNVVAVPDDIDDTRAVFIEPLAAACEVLEQVSVLPEHEVLVIGDGKLALLVAMVLHSTGCRISIAGKHERKLALLNRYDVETLPAGGFGGRRFDIVVEACGNPDAFAEAVAATKPRGTLVLKSTYADPLTFNPAPIVVDEITVVGSRCGQFADAVRFMREHHPPLESLVTAVYPLSEAVAAFERSERSDSLKVILEVAPS
ncbi:MAG: alcohol dehydrogenase catalytic domain-containing protein [Chitinivibrionales bacterium]|nr:alcohol dehydrogenase catalytic domain-containing protein [Chitinivibrionales bacterium]